MALPRKGTRKISVDGVVYRWHMRKQTLEQSFYKERLTLAVEQANTPTRTTLVIDILASHIDHLEGSIGIGIVTPGLVASAIRQALQKGWHPDQTGRSFRMHMKGERPEAGHESADSVGSIGEAQPPGKKENNAYEGFMG